METDTGSQEHDACFQIRSKQCRCVSVGPYSDLRVKRSDQRLPMKRIHSGINAGDLLAYSGGPVPDSHRLPVRLGDRTPDRTSQVCDCNSCRQEIQSCRTCYPESAANSKHTKPAESSCSLNYLIRMPGGRNEPWLLVVVMAPGTG
jgi:hypothetical protein